jgi:putative sulfotransferase
MSDAKAPVLVVGTGRCGSTALSEVIRTNPRWLSLSELFSSLTPGAFPERPLSGSEFAAMLARRRLDYRVLLANRLEPQEFLYPVDAPGARFTRETGVPALAMTTLPHLDGAGDELLDEICDEASAWGSEPIAAHYRRLFERLRGRFGAETWIERSGGSLDYIDSLLEGFPGARFVHIYRDGTRCVLSMSRHATFRMLVLRMRLTMRFGVDPFDSDERPAALTTGSLAHLLPERFDAEAFMGDGFPLWWFAGAWTSQIARGLEALASLPPERVLHMRFERLLAEPVEQVGRLQAFVDGDVDAGWARAAASLVVPGRSRADGELDSTARAIVARGEKILRDAGL